MARVISGPLSSAEIRSDEAGAGRGVVTAISAFAARALVVR